MKISLNNISHQFIVILLTMIIGITVGCYFMSLRSDKELMKLQQKHKQELRDRVEIALKIIERRDKKVDSLEHVIKQDSIKILSYEKRIEQDGVRIEKLRNNAKKLTPEGKSLWLINRYK